MLKLDQSTTFEGRVVRYGVMGEGPPLVFLHGTPFSSQVWRRIAPLFAEHRRVYFYDLLGYGESEKGTARDVSLGIQNRVFASLLHHWNIDRPDVVAHDFGGATALRGWALEGLQYSSLTLIDPVAIRPWGSPLVQHVRQFEEAFSKMPPYMHEAVVRAYLQTAANTPLSPDVVDIYSRPWLSTAGQRAFYQQIAQMDLKYTDEVEAKLAEIPFPVQLLWGQRDEWIDVSSGHELAKRIGQGTVKIVPNAGHLVQEDAPEAIVAAMAAFIGTAAINLT